MAFLTDSADISRLHISSELSLKQRSKLGQFLTPAPIAHFLASQFSNLSGEISLLDPGAGVGTLTAAFVEQLLANPTEIQSCSLTVYEVETKFIPLLKQCLTECCLALESRGITANYSLHHKNFIEANTRVTLPLFTTDNKFTHAILNPPYKKINNQSIEKQILSALGIETVNLYSAFIWLTMLQLTGDGEIVAITPRSFCNGKYFRPFRKALLQELELRKIHIFESRSAAFSEDNILQENIVFHAIKTTENLEYVEITNSLGSNPHECSEIRFTPYSEVVDSEDSQMFIHIVTNSLDHYLRVQMEKFPCQLLELGLEVSTGPVVDFRLKSALSNSQISGNVPLLYPESIKMGKVTFPPTNPRKPITIKYNQETSKWLLQPGWYVLTKRFSAKEEKRRIVAAICPPMVEPALGIENHLNYYHAQGKGMNAELARGLTAFLNSTLFDYYFRQFSGNTQVNVTDLRKIKYPCKEDLIKIGTKIGNSVLEQEQLDTLIHETLEIMSEAKNAIQASKRIQEALAILKSIDTPKPQQNERSALSLLALADIRPETPWNQAKSPLRGITEMMDWFKKYYGKEYAPNTRETVRQQTIHQFIQMGLVIENPDQPNRPINSPNWCYQLHPEALLLLQAYGSEKWKDTRKQYVASVTNLLKSKNRSLPKIPVTLSDGQEIQLSAGGQNQLIKNIVEEFCPRFTPAGIVLYIGDAGDKFIINEVQKMKRMGLELDPQTNQSD